MATKRSKERSGSPLFPEFTETKGHLLKAEKELLLAVRSILDRAIERTEEVGKSKKRKTIKKVAIE